MNFENICVLGLGYIGLPTASTFATHGVKVVGVDTNPLVVNGLQNGQLHIHEPGLRTLVQAALRSGNLVVRDTPQPADAFIIAVPTPFFDNKRADMRYVISAAQSILPHLRRGNLVVLESTSPPRTTCDLIKNILEQSGLRAGPDFSLAYSPERVLPGQILRELIENARVIGGIDPASAESGQQLYSIFVRGEIVLTDATTAEMVKLMENTYRDINIAIANEFSRLADHFGIDIWEAIQIANRHPRVNILQPGPGVGGHCISVDPWFLVEAAPGLTPLIHTARNVNDSQPQFVVDLLRRMVGGSLETKHVAALGLTYKPDVDDFRESPALEIVHLLQHAGAKVSCFDPFQARPALEGIHLCQGLPEAVQEAEVILLLVSHQYFTSIQPADLARQTPARLILDTVHQWTSPTWKEAGFVIHHLGNGKTPL
jgi:UDP-N-acetyl-D-mannosaminuronic acid dehydrogenase